MDDIDKPERIIGFNIFLNGLLIFEKVPVIHIFLGTVEERTKFCFDIYDLNEDRFISKEEMMTMMKSCMVKSGKTEEDGRRVSRYLTYYNYICIHHCFCLSRT